MYLVADAALSIREHFANFGSNIDRLKKRLRAMPGAEDLRYVSALCLGLSRTVSASRTNRRWICSIRPSP